MEGKQMRTLSALLMAAMLFALLPAPAHAAVGDQFTVDGIKYQVLSTNGGTNVAVVANGYSGDVTIPATVTDSASGTTYNVNTIGNGAFQSCAALTSVNMPSVNYIWDSAFRFCTALTSANMPSVTYVGAYAFDGCSKLPSADIHSATAVKFAAFRECASLASVNMPVVTLVDTYAFQNCRLLGSADMPDATSIGGSGFQGCTSLASVNAPAVTSIGSSGFAGCTSLTSVHLPSLTSIGNDGFSGCTALVSVCFESSSMAAGANVFSGCSSGLTVYHTPDATGFDSSSFAGLSLRVYELVGSVTLTGNLRCGETITAVPSGITSTPPITLGMLFYQWTRDGSNIPGSLISTYTLTADDAGKVINVTIWTLKCAGGVSSTNTTPTAKIDPSYTVPTGLTAVYGQRLSNVSLPSGFSWTDPSTSVGNVGTRSFTVTYTPVDTGAYNVVTGIPVTVSVVKGTPAYTVPTGLNADYGDTLADVTLPTGFTWTVPSATSVGNAGSRSFNATYTPTDTANYNVVTDIPVTLSVNRIDPAYTAPDGLTAACGQRLSSVSLPSGFSWPDPSASVGDVGDHSLTVTYTPTDTTNYNVVAGIPVILRVVKGTPAYTVPTGLTATYGDTLADVPLPSGFGWIDPSASVGNVGNHGLTVSYTPADTTNYNVVTGIPVTVSVVKGTPAYTVPTGLNADYGDTLADVTLPTGFTWTVPSATSVGNAGSRSFNATYTPTDTANYNVVTDIPVTLTVNRIDPAYTVPTGLAATYGDTLADVSLPSGFSWADPSASVGSVGNHDLTVSYTPADTTNHNIVAGIPVTLTVIKGTPAYTVPTGLTATYGDTLADVPLPSGFGWIDPSASVGNVGNHGLTVSYTPADTTNYNVVAGIPMTLTVIKGTPAYTVPTGLTATYGDTVADVPLPSGFSWTDPSASVGNVGANGFTVTYTPVDTANHNTVTGIPVTVVVTRFIPSEPVLTYNADVSTGDGASTTLPIVLDRDNGSVTVTLGHQSGLVTSGAIITVPSVPDVDTYTISIPVPDLSTLEAQSSLTLHTGVGSIVIPSNMLTGVPGADGDKARITIEQGDASSLTDEVKAAIGDRPIVRFALAVDGKPIEWNSPGAPVTVSVPYEPTAEELSNPESIVVWYIDGSGKLVSVPSEHYDQGTGTVTFSTTHFSDYAVGYNRVSFGDVPESAWYAKAVSFIAARDITGGTGDGNYSPDAKLTRGEFLVLLMRALAIAPDAHPQDNFTDAGNTYYTGYLAAAKRLGIAAGVGDNMFAPGTQIRRQEMFTLLHKALRLTSRLPQGDSGNAPVSFSDAGQIEPWATEAMACLVKTGIVSGYGGKLFPADTVTRAESAQVLYNLLSR